MRLILGIGAQSNLRVTRRNAWLKLPIVASACVAALAAALTAQAQQASSTPAGAEASGGALEEVVVTAERREENIQNVPITVTAFSADTMQSRNLTDIKSLGNLTPGVYLDGVYLARTIGANQNLLDVDRVEILKGPQGTLLGANTIGGAISITTHTPGNEEKFTAQATGGSYDRRDFGFTGDMPLIKDVLLSTITVSSQVRDGYQKVIPYPQSSPYGQTPFVVDPQDAYPKSGYTTGDAYGGYNTQTIRGKLLWNASDKLTVTTTADWTHQDQEALPYTVLSTFTGNV